MSETKKIPLRTQHEERLLRAAREYARMKVFGISIDESKDCVQRFCAADTKTQVDYLERLLLQNAVDLLSATTIDERDGRLVP